MPGILPGWMYIIHQKGIQYIPALEVSVSYLLQTFDEPYSVMPMIYTICFDINTGLVVNLADMLPADFNYLNTGIYIPYSFTNLDPGDYPARNYLQDGYVPAEGSVITDAWIIDGYLYLYITEPDGRVLQSSIWELPN